MGTQSNTKHNQSLYKYRGQWHRRVDTDSLVHGNTLGIVKTNVGTTATRIEFPPGAIEFILVHRDAGETLYVGGSDATVATGFPLPPDEQLPLKMKKNDNNEVYGICSAGDIDVWVLGVVKE